MLSHKLEHTPNDMALQVQSIKNYKNITNTINKHPLLHTKAGIDASDFFYAQRLLKMFAFFQQVLTSCYSYGYEIDYFQFFELIGCLVVVGLYGYKTIASVVPTGFLVFP